MIRVGGFFAIHRPDVFLKEMKKKPAKLCLNEMEFVELWIENFRGNAELEKNRRFIEQVADLMEGKPLGVHAPILVSNLSNPNLSLEEGIMREYKATIRIASKLGAEYVVVHAGAHPFFMKEREAKTLVAERLRVLSKFAKKMNTVLAIENVPFSQGLIVPCGAKLKEIKYFLSRIPELGFVLDVPHLLFSGDEEIVIDKIHVERMVALHIHDTDGTTDHLEIGKGIIEHEDILKSILSEKEDLLINVEVVGLNEMYRSIKRIKKIVKKISSQ